MATRNEQIRDLTAKLLRRKARFSYGQLDDLLAAIDGAAMAGGTVYQVLKGGPRMERELKQRGFYIHSTEAHWLITWSKD